MGLALLGVLLWDPWASLSAGFWLSFAAVAGIAYLLAGRLGSIRKLVSFVRVQWGLPLLLAPLALGLFDRAPWLASLVRRRSV